MFNIISRKTILAYCKKHRDASSALKQWYHFVKHLDIENFNELKLHYPSASVLDDARVVFNICGNRYRLVVRIVFEFKVIQVKWFGKHSEYDKINVSKIKFSGNENSGNKK
jgi:mRNA interferase HigB